MIELSIIIPHYNSAKSLDILISTIPQKKEIEVIVVDDNSTKYTEEYNALREKWSSDRRLFLKNTTGNQSAGTCRNIGLEQANGKWILFADADDYFVEDFYRIVSSYFDSENDVVFFSPTSIYIDTNQESNRHEKYKSLIDTYLMKKNIENELKLRYEFGVPWSKLIRRKLIMDNNIRFDNVIARNDKLFSTKVGFYMQKFKASKEIIYCVTRNKGSITMTMSEDTYDSRVDVFIRNHSFINQNLSQDEKKFLSLSGFHVVLSAIEAKMSFQKVWKTYRKLKENHIKLFDVRYMNPYFIIKRFYLYLNTFKNERKYHSK